jgi:hypothetical protein
VISAVENQQLGDGGPDRDRTGDLLNAIQARSQLRYRPIGEDATLHFNPAGLKDQSPEDPYKLFEPGLQAPARGESPVLVVGPAYRAPPTPLPRYTRRSKSRCRFGSGQFLDVDVAELHQSGDAGVRSVLHAAMVLESEGPFGRQVW